MNASDMKKRSGAKLLRSARAVFSFPIAPYRQFRRLMIGGSILLIAVICVHMYLFQSILSHNIFQSTGIQAPVAPVVNAKKLDSVLSRYEAKSQTRLQLQTNPVSITDPGK